MVEQACKICRRIVKGNMCPVCKSNEITKNWKGVLVVFDTESQIAKESGITAPGKYAIKVR